MTDQQQPGASEQEKSVYTAWSNQQPAGFFYFPDLVFKAGRESLRAQLADMQRQRDEWEMACQRMTSWFNRKSLEKQDVETELEEARAEAAKVQDVVDAARELLPFLPHGGGGIPVANLRHALATLDAAAPKPAV